MTPSWDLLKVWLTPRRSQRFWARVNRGAGPRGCWPWTGTLTDTGYGQIWICGGVARVHRITWMLARERDIPEWMKIRHWFCDNAPCCNPAHLVGGTAEECAEDRRLLRLAQEASNEAEKLGLQVLRVHLLEQES